MPNSSLLGLLRATWADLDRVYSGLSEADLAGQPSGESSFAWTYAHLANNLDRFINQQFGTGAPHPFLGDTRFRSGSTGEPDDWSAIRAGTSEVRGAAVQLLGPLTDSDVAIMSVVYAGSISELRGQRQTLSYFLHRVITHHYFHIGEVAAKRDRLGHQVGDYPGSLLDESPL